MSSILNPDSLQALDAIPRDRAEWLCWIDMDIVLADPTFTFPLDKVNYTDRDIIIWGGKKQILAGDAEYGGTLAYCPSVQQDGLVRSVLGSRHLRRIGQACAARYP